MRFDHACENTCTLKTHHAHFWTETKYRLVLCPFAFQLQTQRQTRLNRVATNPKIALLFCPSRPLASNLKQTCDGAE